VLRPEDESEGSVNGSLNTSVVRFDAAESGGRARGGGGGGGTRGLMCMTACECRDT
jgi:hypothetical protein